VIYLNDKRQGRKLVLCLKRALEDAGLEGAVTYHHASASQRHREIVETGFKEGKLRWVVAADSLGMGADIKDIGRVIQLRVGDSAGAALQRLGRAGRDGTTPVEGIILFESAPVKTKDGKEKNTPEADDEVPATRVAQSREKTGSADNPGRPVVSIVDR
jgi:Lhr-like helicase